VKAFIIRHYGKKKEKLQLIEVAKPALAEKDVLVQILSQRAQSHRHSDQHVDLNYYPAQMPLILGIDLAGVVGLVRRLAGLKSATKWRYLPVTALVMFAEYIAINSYC